MAAAGDARMRLHHFAHSSASYRVRIVLALKGITVEYVRVSMPDREQQSDAYAQLNPQRMVPCLELPDGAVLPQSLAIIDYLDALQPDPPLWPEDPLARAQTQALVQLIAADTTPLQAKFVTNFLMEDNGLDEGAVDRWRRKWMRRGLEPLQDAVANRPGPYLHGAAPGILDVILVPQMRNARRFGVPVDDLEALCRFDASAQAHPAFAAAHPERWEG